MARWPSCSTRAGRYSYAEALTVGRAIEELGFTGTRTRCRPQDSTAPRKLVQHLDIPVLATELTLGGLHTLPQWITRDATDMLRGDVVIKGGITGMMKIGHLAEAFHMNCEVHDAYNAMNNVATLHVDGDTQLRLVRGPLLQPGRRPHLEHLSYGLADPIDIDADGYVHAPDGPGSGSTSTGS